MSHEETIASLRSVNVEATSILDQNEQLTLFYVGEADARTAYSAVCDASTRESGKIDFKASKDADENLTTISGTRSAIERLLTHLKWGWDVLSETMRERSLVYHAVTEHEPGEIERFAWL